MQSDPTTISAEGTPVQATEVTQALSMTDTYSTQAANKLAQVAEIIGGKDVATWGITGDNLKKVMMFIGAYTSLKFLTTNEKVLKYKWHIAGTAIAIIAARNLLGQKSSPSKIASNPQLTLPSSTVTTQPASSQVNIPA